MTSYINLNTFEVKGAIEQIIALETLIQLQPTINIISSMCVNSKWTFIVGVYNDDYNTNFMNKTFRNYLSSLKLEFREYISVGIYGFRNKTLQYNTDLILKKYIELFEENKIKIISYNIVNTTPLSQKNNTIIGIADVYVPYVLIDSSVETLLIFHINNLTKVEHLLKTTKPIGN